MDHKTVSTQRESLETTGEIPQLDKTVGADGKSRTTTSQKQTPQEQTTTPPPEENEAVLLIIQAMDGAKWYRIEIA